jgi:hypothetical protein
MDMTRSTVVKLALTIFATDRSQLLRWNAAERIPNTADRGRSIGPTMEARMPRLGRAVHSVRQ